MSKRPLSQRGFRGIEGPRYWRLRACLLAAVAAFCAYVTVVSAVHRLDGSWHVRWLVLGFFAAVTLGTALGARRAFRKARKSVPD